MNAHPKHFGSPSGEPSITTTRPTPQQMCEKLWTLPLGLSARAHDRILKVTRSIADLDAAPNIPALDRSYWA